MTTPLFSFNELEIAEDAAYRALAQAYENKIFADMERSGATQLSNRVYATPTNRPLCVWVEAAQ